MVVVRCSAFSWISLELPDDEKETEELEDRFSRKKAPSASLVVDSTRVSVNDPDLMDSSSSKSPINSLHLVYILANVFLFAPTVGEM